MGGSQSENSNLGLIKGEGYRIINVRPNSPLEGQVDVFFDFIIDALPLQLPQKNAREILDKLTDSANRKPIPKKLSEIFNQNENKPISLRVVSTKYRTVKSIEVIPNKNWNGHNDLIGIQTRLERYDQSFETYFPVSDIRENSPAKKAGIQPGDYLIGCKEFKYCSIDEMLENIYDRFFDKEVQDKHVHFALYNIANDDIRLTPVLLSRGWGDKGLIGFNFLEGHLNKFPKDLQSARAEVIKRKKISAQSESIKKQLSSCNGASHQLIQSLKAQRKRKPQNLSRLKHLLLEVAPKRIQPKDEKSENETNEESKHLGHKVQQLQKRVQNLQQMLQKIKRQILSQEQERCQILQK